MLSFLMENTQEVLDLALAFSAVLVSIFLSLALLRLFITLGVLKSFIEELQDTLEIVQNYLWQPARFFLAVKEKFLEIFSFLKKK